MSANLKRGCGILLIASVVLLSILALLPDADVDHDAGYTSSELSIRETVDGSVTSTSYVNPDGVITEAIDMGYATVCRMRDDSDRVVEERYLDANGDPVARYGDYYGLSYDLVALLKRTINEYKRVTVFMNQQYLCKKEHGRYCSIQGPIETIRRIWEETNAPMVFCCNESFVDAINGNDEDSQDIGNSFRWRNGGFVVKGREQCE